jgi:diguanylate cyclase (GGDEF)-like protein/PAS domain S-box-containing protein
VKTIYLPCSHPDLIKLQLPDLSCLDPDDPLRLFSASTRQRRLELEADSESLNWWLEMAVAAQYEGSFTHAIACAGRATVYGLETGNDVGVMQSRLVNVAVELRKGNYDDAHQTVRQMAQAFSESPGEILEAIYREADASLLLRSGHYSTGEYPTATASARRAIEIYRAHGDIEGEIRSLAILGGALAGQGDYPAAIQQFAAGIRKCHDADNWRCCHLLLWRTGLTLADQGYRQGVDELYGLAGQWANFVGDRVAYADILAGQGRLYYYVMDDGAADEFEWRSAPLVAGARMAVEMGAQPTAMACYTTLASLCEKAHDPAGTEHYKRLVQEMVEASQIQNRARMRIQQKLELEAVAHKRNRGMADRLYQGIETSPDAFFIFDVRWGADGSATDYVNQFRNAAANELLGLRPDSVRMLAELSANPLFDGVKAALQVAVEDGKDSQHELRVDLPGGRVQWLIRRVTPSANGAVVMFRDVSESRNLRILSGRIQLANRAGRVGVFEFDADAGRLTWDAAMYELYGTEPGAFGGRLADWLALIHPEDRDRVSREWEAVKGATEEFESDFRLLSATGEVRFIHAQARVTRAADGSAARIVGSNLDVTGHKLLAEELFDEKERLRVTLQSIVEAVISTDTGSRITFMNPAAEQMTGWLLVEAAGHRLSEVFHLIDERTGQDLPASAEECIAHMRPVYVGEGGVLISRNGERRDVQQSSAPVRTSSGEIIGAVLVFQDITRSRSLQRELLYTAMHDSLTGLPNRVSFERKLNEACERAREAGGEHALCFIDLDRFKIVNDSAGHAAGDALLREVGALIRASVRYSDFTARLGGDEFALLLLDCSLDMAESAASELVDAIGALRFPWNNRVYDIGASIGITAITRHFSRAAEVMGQADVACYAAKAAGRNRVSVYDGANSGAGHVHQEIQVASRIRTAIDGNRFRLFAQEIRGLSAGVQKGRSYELLLRMESEEGVLLPPGAFIPAAERYDLMSSLDRWVVQTVVTEHAARMHAEEDLTVCFNLSANSLNDPALLPYLLNMIRESGLPAERLGFEITETALINSLAAADLFVEQIRGIGCRVTLDNFGKGLSSFTYLRQFTLDGIKIDGSFIRRLKGSSIDQAIVESINDVGHRIGVRTTAECVEDLETLAICREMGIDFAQGYAISRPIPFEQVFLKI